MVRMTGSSMSEASLSGRRFILVDGGEETHCDVIEQLLSYNCRVDEAATAAQALQLVNQRHYDMVLLEARLPDMDGLELCRQVRQRNFRAPIVFLSASGSDADIILALRAGANDYITKPCRPGVLLARMEVQLRQFEH